MTENRVQKPSSTNVPIPAVSKTAYDAFQPQFDFRKIYNDHVGLVHFIARKYELAPDDIEDVVQETFLRLHSNLGNLRDIRAVTHWLSITARNLCIDRLRHTTRFPTTIRDNFDDTADNDVEASEASRREIMLSLCQEIMREFIRQPGGDSFKLFYSEGWTARQIAERNQEPISTVTTRLSRLRIKFKELIIKKLKESDIDSGDE